MKIIITGSGITIYFLAKRFISKGFYVSVVSNNEEDCDYYARNLKAEIIHGAYTDFETIAQADGHEADVFIGMTPLDQENLVLCQIANEYYKIPHILAVVNDPDNEEVFRKIGVKAVSPSRLLLESIESMSSLDDVRQQFSAVEGRILLTELSIREGSRTVGRNLMDIALPGGVLVGAILRGEDAIIPQGNTTLRAGDRLLIISQAENQALALSIFA